MTSPPATFGFLLLWIAISSLPQVAQAADPPAAGGPLSPWLQELYAVHTAAGTGAATAGVSVVASFLASSSPLFHVDEALLAEGRVRVQLDAGPGADSAEPLRTECQQRLEWLDWEGSCGRLAQITLPIAALPELARIPGLYCAMRPPTGLPMAIVSEGVAEMGAPPLHDQEADGRGYKIGILDVGFAGAKQLIARGEELPADTRWRAFAGSPSGNGDFNNNTSHGTACAEIVHDVAPGAKLYLANASTVTELRAAIRWLRDEGVSIISHSVGWFWGPGDGTGEIVEEVQAAIDDGLLWVNAVGNQALAYYGGAFTDLDGDGRHEFDPTGDESITDTPVAAGTEYVYVLTWDRWPYTHGLGFEMDLYEDGQLMTTSEQATTPAGYAYREIFYTSQTPGSRVDLVIRRKSGSDSPRLRLFRLDNHHLGEHGGAAGSYVIPADAAEVLSVGAYYLDSNRPVLEPFSSHGPTFGQLSKPEICALDRVTTFTSAPFQGTSAACPHVAGAAAVLFSAAPRGGFFDFRWSREDLWSLFAASAEPAEFGNDDATGWGLLRLPAGATAGGSGANGIAPALSASSPAGDTVRLQLRRAVAGPALLEVFDATGRRVQHMAVGWAARDGQTWEWRTRAESGALLPAGMYLLRLSGPGWETCGRTILVR